jgi:photosystem II stability/assembly factor-like uncharacterized protein
MLSKAACPENLGKSRLSRLLREFLSGKKIFIILLFLIFHCTLKIEVCNSQWVQCDGLYGGMIQSLTANENFVFTHVYRQGCYRSSNNGANWSYIGLLDKYVMTIETNGNTIYAGTSVGLYMSTNNGTNWFQTSLNNKYVHCILLNGNNIYIGIYGGIYLSTNGGNNWSLYGLNSEEIMTLHVVNNYLFAGSGHGIFITSNNGLNWSQTLNNPTRSIYSITSLGNTVIAAGVWGIYRSTNFGSNWTQPYYENYGLALAVQGNNIFAGIQTAGLLLSNDSGQTWYSSGFNGSMKSVEHLSVSGNKIFAAIYGIKAGLYLSTNYGVNWAMTHLNNQAIYSLANNGNYFFAGTEDWVYVSSNYGTTWTKPVDNIVQCYALLVNQNNLFASASSIVCRSTNNGTNWQYYTPLTQQINCFIFCGNNFFVGTQSGLILSTNNGVNWSSTGLSGKNVSSLAVSGINIYAGTDSSGVYSSSNNGTTWYQIGLNDKAVYSLNANGSNLFAGTKNFGIYYSSNYGLNWSQTSLVNNTVRSLISNNNVLFAGTDSNGVYISTNNGQNWIKKNQGFPFVPKINTLMISNSNIYAGTYGLSLWKRSLSEIIGIQNISKEIPKEFSLYQNYPNPFNPTTKIRFDIPALLSFPNVSIGNPVVALKVYDLLGREIQTLVNEKLNPGTYEVTFDGSNYASGIYFYRLTTYDFSETKKFVLMK